MDSKSNNIAPKKLIDYQKTSDNNLRKMHVEQLGLAIPENYFSNSKQEILAKISGEKEKTKRVSFLKPRFAWYAAASIIFLIAIALFKPNNNFQIDDNHTIVSDTIKALNDNKFGYEIPENDILISSLLVEDSEVDALIDDYILNKTLTDDTLLY